MNDKYGYDEMKNVFDEKMDDETTFKAKLNMALNDEYRETGVYNGYNAREAALNDYEEIARKHNFRVVNFDGDLEVKSKSIERKDKIDKIKKTVIAVLVATGVAFGSISFVDFANHPEDYFTTHPEFDGPATFSEIIDRTPENFGIGGR